MYKKGIKEQLDRTGIYVSYFDDSELETTLVDGTYPIEIGHFKYWGLKEPSEKAIVKDGVIDLVSVLKAFPTGYNMRDDHTCLSGISIENGKIVVYLDS